MKLYLVSVIKKQKIPMSQYGLQNKVTKDHILFVIWKEKISMSQSGLQNKVTKD
jgi:hypothetical protein